MYFRHVPFYFIGVKLWSSLPPLKKELIVIENQAMNLIYWASNQPHVKTQQSQWPFWDFT